MNKEKYLQVVNCLKGIISGTKWDYHVFSVGGCCRDYMSGREIKDIDLVVDLPNGGIEFAEWLESNGYTKGSVVTYPHYGTAMFHLKEVPEIELEAVQTRKESYRDMETRNPDTAFGTIDDDCTRRDFTYNAIYYNISNGGFCDYNGHSFEDLGKNILRTCGDPDIIFTEDPLRILRAIRFTCRFDSTIEDATFEGMKKYADRLEIISKERIQDEFSKMMTSGHADIAMKLINEIGAWKYIFNGNTCGEIEMALANLKKITDADYHNLEVNLAIVYAYLADVENRMKYLKFSNDVIDKVMFYLDLVDEINFLHFKPSNLRKLQYFAKSFDNLFNACTIFLSIFPNDEKKVMKIINDSKYMIKDGCAMFGYRLPVDGNDVMAIKNIEPSAKVKEYLELLMEQAYVNPHITKKDCEKILNCN